MVVGRRITERLKVVAISQSELARRVGMSQGAMNNLIAGRSRSSTHLHKIARNLATTSAYLSGETDDPDEGAPPPPEAPAFTFVSLPVALPSTDALAQMFEGLLAVADRSAPVDALARELAEMLPTGLSAIRGPLLAQATPVRKVAARALASADRIPPR